jgi:hypothetical protein
MNRIVATGNGHSGIRPEAKWPKIHVLVRELHGKQVATGSGHLETLPEAKWPKIDLKKIFFQ